MVYLCSYCQYFHECIEEDRVVCRCERNREEVQRWYAARKACFSDRRKNKTPWAGMDRRRQWVTVAHK